MDAVGSFPLAGMLVAKGMYYGMILVLSALAFSLFVYTRDRLYLSYASYVGAYGFMHLNIDRVIPEDVLFLGVKVHDSAFFASHFAVTVAVAFFLSDFFRITRTRPILYRIVQTMKVAAVFCCLLSLPAPGVASRILPFFGLTMAVCVTSIVLASWRLQPIASKYFLGAWTILILSGINYNLAMLGLVQSNGWLPSLLLQGGSALQMVIITFSIGHIFKQANQTIELQRASMVTSSKLAAVGEMAAGIAHEVNNPLQIITNVVQNLEYMLDRGMEVSTARIKTSLSTISRTAERIADIVQALRFISRDEMKGSFAVTPLTSCILPAVSLCSERFRTHGVTLQISELPEDLLLHCNAVQLSQVVLNLLSNAFDAARDDERAPRIVRLDVEDRGHVLVLRVENTGATIAPVVAERVFEPFFTTKAVGEGTGLGLSLARRFVELHGGRIWLDRATPLTTFVVELGVHGRLQPMAKSS